MRRLRSAVEHRCHADVEQRIGCKCVLRGAAEQVRRKGCGMWVVCRVSCRRDRVLDQPAGPLELIRGAVNGTRGHADEMSRATVAVRAHSLDRRGARGEGRGAWDKGSSRRKVASTAAFSARPRADWTAPSPSPSPHYLS
eukprot:scaffold279735_cov37-Tisochrysis_lutea.AAC.3